jgi:2-oxoisovalerate dehydrogenase E1 component
MMMTSEFGVLKALDYGQFKTEILKDYRLALISRLCSLAGRKEVLTGKAKFGIFGDGKEIAQIAYARQFRNGDWRSGYYRDQTFMMAAGLLTIEEFFSQLFGTADEHLNPGNAGRSFNNHFATRNVDKEGEWLDLTNQKNSAADLSPTAGHMPRLLGLALASKLFRQNPELVKTPGISSNGNEVAFGTIGDASTSEGHFFETMNAAGVLSIPLAVAIWDDGYGISVPTVRQTIKASISKALKGFERNGSDSGILIFEARGWDYPGLCSMFEEGIAQCRRNHVPVLFHVTEMTQPLGHSTSGSHERYKSPERLAWESEHDCLAKMKGWILEHGIAAEGELTVLEQRANEEVAMAREQAWNNYQAFIREERAGLLAVIENKSCECRQENADKIQLYVSNLKNIQNPIRKDNISMAKKILRYVCIRCPKRESFRKSIQQWIGRTQINGFEKYSAYLYNETRHSVLNVSPVEPQYTTPEMVTGREILRDNFDALFAKYPLLVAFGEDVGKIGGVNQTYEGLQNKYGEQRVFDTGIRETSIIGKGIGLALRGFRPIAEIQYFDYLLYALQILSDDLATTHWRTAGSQCIPLIISTRGHRLEGIWHSGSPLSMVINSIRGIFVCVPRNMTQAAGFYNTLMEGRDPALVIEPLNAYRLKEMKPDNPGEYKIPLGIPEILEQGSDITLVTYGSCVRIAQDAVKQLRDFDISVELIDVQTLLPFDLNEIITASIKKTSRVVFFDEDVPGGATAYMMQQVIEGQGAYRYLDSQPRTLAAKEHRPAYSTDGDYFSNPSAEDVFDALYSIMHEANPQKYPELY